MIDQAQNREELIRLAKILEEQLKASDENRLTRYIPHERGVDGGQLAFHKAAATHQIRLLITGNRWGKSTCSVIEAIWFCLGIHPYKQMRLPVKGKLYADSYPMVMENIKLKLDHWLPKKYLNKERPFINNQQGMLVGVNFANGSILKIGSYDQEMRKAEGSDWDFIGFDEPPPRELYVANLRGLVDSGGIMWFSMTPLSEAWIYDDLWMPGMMGEKKHIKCFRGTSSDNPHINKRSLEIFESELTEEEKKIRILGEFSTLRGLVINTYQPHISDIDSFELNGDWILYEGIDPHPNKAHAALWKAINVKGVRVVVDELSCEGGIREFGREVALKRKQLTAGGAVLARSVCDTSLNSKDPANRLNLRTELCDVLRAHGEEVMPFNAQKKDWLHPGIQKLKDLYRVVEQEDGELKPMQYIFADRCRRYKNELLHYQWPDGDTKDNANPVKKFDEYIDCLEDGIEILTKDGWKGHEKIGFGDLIATVNYKSNMELEYQPPEEIVVKDYRGKMIYLDGNLSFKVTPNHRMIVHPHPTDKRLIVKKACELNLTHQIPLTSNWAGEYEDYFTLPGAVRRWGNSTKKEEDKKIKSEVWAEFLGWYISEGSLTKPQFPGRGWQVTISQNDGEYKERIRKIMKFLDIGSVADGSHCLTITNKSLWLWLFENCKNHSHLKRVPEWIKKSDIKTMKIFWKAAVDGDGWRQGNSETYATVSRELANDMQEVLIKMGYSTTLFERLPRDSMIRGRKVFKENCRMQYWVRMNKRKKATLHTRLGGKNKETKATSLIREVNYEGIVWCVSVPNKAFIARSIKNKRSFIIGNCDRYIESLAPHYHTPGNRFLRVGGNDAYKKTTWRERYGKGQIYTSRPSL